MGDRYQRDSILRGYETGVDGVYGRYRYRVSDVSGCHFTNVPLFTNHWYRFKGFLQVYQLQTENDEEETWRDLVRDIIHDQRWTAF